MGEPSGTEGSRPVRVILADNHAMFRQSVASMLAADGEVEVLGDAGSGPEAIDLAKEHQPDLIIMQVEQEPDEAATEIRGMLVASPDSRVVVLTAHQDPRILGKRLARIIHERSGGLRSACGNTDEYPSKAANSPHIDSDHSKSRFPYSSTKLGFVNNPG